MCILQLAAILRQNLQYPRAALRQHHRRLVEPAASAECHLQADALRPGALGCSSWRRDIGKIHAAHIDGTIGSLCPRLLTEVWHPLLFLGKVKTHSLSANSLLWRLMCPHYTSAQ